MSQMICKGITLAYEGHTVCQGLDLTINKGDYICIVGDNGSGKSTLMKALLSLKSAEHGTIELGDGLSKRDIGYLPQQSEEQKDFPASVEEVVLSGCVAGMGKRCFMGKQERLEAMQNMKMMGIYELAHESYKNLSGGQQQRVLLARALCAASKVLILDEPVSGLDPNATADMYSLIHHLNKHTGMTVIMVTHDIENSLHDANKVLHMSLCPQLFENVEDYRRAYWGGESK